LVAPILVFTADEVWENIPGAREASVHIAEFPVVEEREDNRELLATWERLLDVRSLVQKALEEKRNQKVIGASVEAKVVLQAGGELHALLERYKEQLPALFIVSQVELQKGDSEELQIEVAHAAGARCERCWNWSETVGSDPGYPTLDARCVRHVGEGWGAQ
jgi:isoleucyl-tRNA synthetase